MWGGAYVLAYVSIYMALIYFFLVEMELLLALLLLAHTLALTILKCRYIQTDRKQVKKIQKKYKTIFSTIPQGVVTLLACRNRGSVFWGSKNSEN